MRQKTCCYNHLSKADRNRLYLMKKEGKSLREIGRALGRSASTITRELRRNSLGDEEVDRKASFMERSSEAHKFAEARRKIPRKRDKISCHADLKSLIIQGIKDSDKSPRNIAYDLRAEHEDLYVCSATIYNYINKYKLSDLKECLRYRGGKFRNNVTPRATRRKLKKVLNSKKKSIHDMPSYALLGIEFGHLQVDCIVSCKNGSGEAILSIVDIYTHHVWFFKVKDLQSETILASLRGFIGIFPPGTIKTILSDNGSEFEHLGELEAKFKGLKVYYCDPYSPFQRGLNEYCNREFRWYFPKGTDFGNVSYAEVWKATDKLSIRRRPCLFGKSSKELLEQALKVGPSRIELVDAKRSWEWNPCSVDLSSLLEKKQVQYQGWQKSEAGLYFPQSSDLSLPLQGLSGYSSFYSQSIGIG